MKLRIGHLDYTVSALTEEDQESARDRGYESGVAGSTWPTLQRIGLDPANPPDRQLEVLIHEVFHAIWDAYCMGRKVDEETAVATLSAGLTAVIRSNPTFLTTLVSLSSGKGLKLK